MIEMKMRNKQNVNLFWLCVVQERKSIQAIYPRVNTNIKQNFLSLELNQVARSADLDFIL